MSHLALLGFFSITWISKVDKNRPEKEEVKGHVHIFRILVVLTPADCLLGKAEIYRFSGYSL